jgi:S-(hydroxymethyl)glutathione dehydrogenase / alcohol dehydrogenase
MSANEDTSGKPIVCKAAVIWAANEPFKIEDVTVSPPSAGEVRVKVLYNALCHTDASCADGSDPEGVFPAILGHEATGVVESVGEGVTSVSCGDVVIPLYTAECQRVECVMCSSEKTNLCPAVRATQGRGVMPDGTRRFRVGDDEVYHFMGTSTLSQYTVLPEVSVAKIQSDAKKESVCLLGCGVTTGIGAVLKKCKVEEGATAAVFGLGAVGLSVIMGLRMAGAGRIIAVDINDAKFALAKQLGATDAVNPRALAGGQGIVDAIVAMTRTERDTIGGVDYSFDCTGNVVVMQQAFECVHKGWGTCCIIGVAAAGKQISFRPFHAVIGKNLCGVAFGGYKGRSELPSLVEQAMDGHIPLDDLITHRLPLDQVNEGFRLLHEGKAIRCVLTMWPDNE